MALSHSIIESDNYGLIGFLQATLLETRTVLAELVPAYAACGSIAVADGPLPVGDMIGAAGAALITVGALGYGIYQATHTSSISNTKDEDKTNSIAISEKNENPVCFPVDPNVFNPIGLTKVPRPEPYASIYFPDR